MGMSFFIPPLSALPGRHPGSERCTRLGVHRPIWWHSFLFVLLEGLATRSPLLPDDLRRSPASPFQVGIAQIVRGLSSQQRHPVAGSFSLTLARRHRPLL
jgi:hypothetical protein